MQWHWFALHQSKEVGHPWLDGEIIHLVIEEEAGVAGNDLRAEQGIDGVGDGNGVSLRVDNGIVRRFRSAMRFCAGRTSSDFAALVRSIRARMAAE